MVAMIGRSDFDEAIRNGERNKEAIPLIRNWCVNARIVPQGYGLVAQQLELPIGHHSIECDFASDSRISYHYELRDAAIDFHDRNCFGCVNRKGGRLPNITEFVAARDREREREDELTRRRKAAKDTAVAERDAQRSDLRMKLSPVAQTLVDDIGAFDREASQENFDRLMRSAEMAPEHFSQRLVEYIFGVCENSDWFEAPGMTMLSAVGADPSRLAAITARALAGGRHNILAASILTPLVSNLDADAALGATPAAMQIANPDRRFSPGGNEPTPDPSLLEALYGQHQEAVAGAVERLLGSRSVHGAELAGRGLLALLRQHPEAATRHARSLISTYARAPHLLDNFDNFNNNLNGLADAVVGAFDADPAGTDKLLQEYAEGASSEITGRVYELYGRALRPRRQGELPTGSERVRIAFRRLLWATTGEFNEEVMRTAISTFRDSGGHLQDVAKSEIDALLSAPFLLVQLLDTLEGTALNPANPLATMERANHRSAYLGVLTGLLDLAARAASKDAELLPRLSAFFESIPEDGHQLRAIAIEEFARLAENVGGLQFYLPYLYRAMVGPSSLERSYAAKAVGELRQSALENVPLLLFEAFCLLLQDSYVIVHMAAARAFRSAGLPGQFRPGALWSIYNLVHHYRIKSGEDRFVAECVRTLAGSAEEFGNQAGAMRSYLIDVCMDIDPLYLRSHMSGLSHTLGQELSFARLVIRMVPTMIAGMNSNDEAERLVRRLSSEAIRAHKAEFEAMGVQLAASEQWMTLVTIDALARAGCGTAAARVAGARIVALEDVPRNRGTRLFARLVELAFTFEDAVAADDAVVLDTTVTEWREIEKVMKEHREEQRERDLRSHPSFPG